MSFFRHFRFFLKDLFAFARAHKVYWLVPLMVILLIVAVLLIGVSTISPFIYSLF